MPIQSIEIICVPCPKCEGLERRIRSMIESIGMSNRTKIIFEFKHTTKLTDISKYSLNPAQTPAILINGEVEMAGRVDPIVLRRKLEAIQRSC